MITDQDITKLKKVFLTKDEALSLLSKEDAKNFLTKEDAKNFLTKKDGEKFATKEALADLSLEVGELHDKFDGLNEKFDKVDNTLHFIVGELAEMREDNAAWLSLFTRHSHQIEYIADYVGISDLPQD